MVRHRLYSVGGVHVGQLGQDLAHSVVLSGGQIAVLADNNLNLDIRVTGAAHGLEVTDAQLGQCGKQCWCKHGNLQPLLQHILLCYVFG